MKQQGVVEALSQSPQVLKGAAVTVTSGGAAGSAGVWAWMGENASQLTVLFGFVGMCCAVSGLCYTIYQGQKALKRREDDDETLNR